MVLFSFDVTMQLFYLVVILIIMKEALKKMNYINNKYILIYLFIISLLLNIIFHGLSLLFVYRKYSPEYLVSIFLFIASADYISWMFNGIRQFTAVTLIFAATTLILKKKYLPVLLIVLLASTVHQSALLMIPFILIAYGKAWNKKTLLFVLQTRS